MTKTRGVADGRRADGTVAARTRSRQPAVRRALILDAARACFADKGYANATIREIAAAAGVTHGLIMHNFGSKERLFAEAVPGPRGLADNVAGDPAGLPDRVARNYVERMEAQDGSDPFVALIRSAATDLGAARELLGAMRADSLAAYRTVMAAEDTPVRVDLLGAHLIGVTFNRYVLRDGPLADMGVDELVRYLSASIRGIVTPAPADPGRNGPEDSPTGDHPGREPARARLGPVDG